MQQNFLGEIKETCYYVCLVSGSPGFHLMVLTCKLINYVFTGESVHCQVNSHHIPCTHSAPPEYFYSNNV